MSDLYSEWIVKRKAPAWGFPAKIGMILLTAVLFFLSFTGILWFLVIIAGITGYLTYLLALNCDLEYEYIFVKGELDIDKIMGKQKRKRCAVLDMEQIDVIAPEGSYALDAFKNDNYKKMDFSSGIADHKKYVIYGNYKNEKVCVLFEPNEKMLQDMRNSSPRKVNLK